MAYDRRFNVLKQEDEEFPIGIKFGNDLATSETISSVATTAIDDSDDSDVSDDILDGSAQIGSVGSDDKTFTADTGNSDISQGIKGGTAGERYKISFVITTSASSKYEADVYLDIVNL